MGKQLNKKIDEAQEAAALVHLKYSTVITNQEMIKKILKDIETLDKQKSKKLAKILEDEIRELSKAYGENVSSTREALETLGAANEQLKIKLGNLRAHIVDREKRGKGDKKNTQNAQQVVETCWSLYKDIKTWRTSLLVMYK